MLKFLLRASLACGILSAAYVAAASEWRAPAKATLAQEQKVQRWFFMYEQHLRSGPRWFESGPYTAAKDAETARKKYNRTSAVYSRMVKVK